MGNFEVEIRCPHCGKLHTHRDVSAGEVRFCDLGRGRYQILLPREHVQTTGHLEIGNLVVDCPICGKKHFHGDAKIKPGDVVHLESHCAGASGSYYVTVEGGNNGN
jgi:endogenous inhibitor of DNA gyrase (YacG/DUF329 family)